LRLVANEQRTQTETQFLAVLPGAGSDSLLGCEMTRNPLTESRQFDILQSGTSGRGPNAIR